MNTICISLGGSIISREDGVNVKYAKELAGLLKKYQKKYKFIIVVGGGYANKLYVTSSKQIISNNAVLDEIGIAFTRINALILKDLLSELDVYPNVVTELNELKMATNSSKIVVLGGLLPGISTDAVSVLASEVVNSKVMINVSSIAYIYDMPPSNKKAKPIKSLTHNKLIEIASKYDTREARSHFLFDLMASKLAKRAGIEIRFVNDDIKELEQAINNKEYRGSRVNN